MNLNSEKIILGSRQSLLAQEHIRIFENECKKKFRSSEKVNLVTRFFKTSGDKFQNKRISDIGNKGLFSKEIDEALLRSEINLGIHSLKDLPTTLPDGLEIGAVLKREDFREALITRQNTQLKKLKEKAIIGTSSIRREMQLKRIRPDFIIKDIRGNIDTRIQKLNEKKFDAIVLAYAGLKRLGIISNYHIIDPRTIIPALGQGAIALVINKKNRLVNRIIKELNHEKTSIETECERLFLKALDGSCQTPVGGYAILKGSGNKRKIFFYFKAFSNDGEVLIKDKVCFGFNNFRSESYNLGVQIKKKINI
ncbi:MAG: hydroxymethylbilane synthase [Pseudomonadota bacterium]|nr:hydroxymethylbilane synthase [Pseudomonadota bacterium]